MPKQILKIDQFHGGLNSNADPRDIAPNELSVGTDIMIDELGKVRNMGGITSAVTANAAAMEAGYGLFHFSHDRLGATTSGTEQGDSGDDYLAMADTATSQIDIYSNTTTAWGTGQIDLGGGTSGMKAIFYVADGSLRVSDAAFGASNQNQWFGYIERTHFNGVTPGGSADAYDGWYYKSLDLAAPTAGVFGQAVAFTDTTSGAVTTEIEFGGGSSNIFEDWGNFDGEDYIAVVSGQNARIITEAKSDHDDLVTVANAGGWNTQDIEVYPPIGAGWDVYFDQSSDSGNWTPGLYRIGTTFIYEGNQESNVFDIHANGNQSKKTADVIAPGSALDVKIFASSPYDPFIIGGRVYIRKTQNDSWVLLADISLKDGVRSDLSTEYTAWTLRTSTGSGDAPSSVYCMVDLGAIVTPSVWTYETINGYASDESISIGSVGEGFKTAVVANRQVYIGNVKRLDEDGVKVQEGDAMYKSVVNKFDTFPIARKIEASVQDGDEIVKLEEYADRILQFKKNKMHLINISQDVEFLEDTFMHKGIVEPAAACKTDFGIAWVNELGAYLYDGKQVTNLLEKEGRQMIKESDWSTFVGGKPTIGYIAKKRQILVGSTTGTGSDGGDIYLYDLVTRSWVQGKNKIVDGVKRTNFVVDWNGDLVCAHTSNTGTVVKWDDASDASSNVDFQTKDIDFGQPGQRKKIYKVYITYRGNATHVQVYYGVDGLTPALTFNNITSGTDGSSTGSGSNAKCIPYDAGVTDWLKAELKPSASINNISSFRLKISGDGSNAISADFEINDISIVYRLKGIK